MGSAPAEGGWVGSGRYERNVSGRSSLGVFLAFGRGRRTATLLGMASSNRPRHRTALICGISGQDGAYLAAHLLGLGYRVIGTSRDAQASRFEGLVRLGIRDQVTVASMSLVDFRSTMQAVARHEPDEIYNLAGQTSVGLSFDQPVETFESIGIGTLNLLEAIRMSGRDPVLQRRQFRNVR